jgi:GR25 family glycosyltransferase involved in LPS biosynthesis
MDRIPKIFVINLPHRVDRLNSIKKELERMGLLDKMEIVEGVIIGGPECAPAGITEAHTRCIELARERQYEMVMILEDDCKFLFDKDRIHSEIEKFLNTAPPDWNGLWFGSFFTMDYEYAYDEKNWGIVHIFNQQTAVLLHNTFYSNLIDTYRYCRDKYIETGEVIYQIDAWLPHNKTKIFVLKNKICGQADNFSDRVFLDMNGGCSTSL